MSRPTSRRGRQPSPARYPRAARVNEILREVLAEAVERLADTDGRLELATITAVRCDPDFRRAVVLLSSLDDEEAEALAEARVRLQAEISRQVRLKRTPQLSFEADPAVATGLRIEEIIRDLPRLDPGPGLDAEVYLRPGRPPGDGAGGEPAGGDPDGAGGEATGAGGDPAGAGGGA